MTERHTIEQLAQQARLAYRTVEDMVHHVIREGIVTGVYEPGERLPQDSIAEIMGVSRIPVRAALRRLEAEGFVDVIAHRGATVRSLTPKDIAEIYDLRIILETYALRAAATHVTAEGLDELEALADRMDETDDPDQWVEQRQLFYQRLYDISDRPRTVELINQLRADVGRYWLMQRVTEGHEGQSHRILISALRSGDSIDAEEWLQQHLTGVSKELQRRIAENPSDSS